MARNVSDINGSAMNTLRSVKLDAAQENFRSGLDNDKQRAMSEEIVKALASILKNNQTDAAEYLINTLSKTDDNILGRIGTKLQDLSEEQLDDFKQEIDESIIKALEDIRGSQNESRLNLEKIREIISNSEAEPQTLLDANAALFNSIKTEKSLQDLRDFFERNNDTERTQIAESKELESEKPLITASKAAIDSKNQNVPSNAEKAKYEKAENITKNIEEIRNNVRKQTALLDGLAFKIIPRTFKVFVSKLQNAFNLFKKMNFGMLDRIKHFKQSFSKLGQKTASLVKAPFKIVSNKISSLTQSTKKSFSTVTNKVSTSISNSFGKFSTGLKKIFINPFKKKDRNSVEKQEEKPQKKLTLLDKVMKVVNIISQKIGEIAEAIIVPIAKAIGKAIDHILAPIFKAISTFLWTSGIMAILLTISASILLISIGVMLVAAAIKEFMDLLYEYADQLPPNVLATILKNISIGIGGIGVLLNGIALAIEASSLILHAIGKTLTLAVDLISPIVKFISEAFTKFFSMIVAVIDSLAEMLKPALDFIKSLIMKIMQKLEPIIGILVDVVADVMLTILKGIQFGVKLFTGIVNRIRGAAASVLEKLANVKLFGFRPFAFLAGKSSGEQQAETSTEKDKMSIEQLYDKLEMLFKKSMQDIADTIKSLVASIIDATTIASLMKDMFASIMKVISKTARSIIKVVSDASLKIIDIMKTLLQPLAYMHKTTGAMPNNVNELSQTDAKKMQESIANAVVEKMNTVYNISNIANSEKYDDTSLKQMLESSQNIMHELAEDFLADSKEQTARHSNLMTFLDSSFSSLSKKIDDGISMIPIPIGPERANQALLENF